MAFRFLIALIVMFSWFGTALADEGIEAQALDLEHQLMAPCCYGGTVAGHDSEPVRQMRQDIRERLRQGMTPEQIKDAYVAQFGEQILAAPPTRGFHMIAYILPPLILAIGLFILVLFLRRFKKHPEPTPAKLDPGVVTQIELELQQQENS